MDVSGEESSLVLDSSGIDDIPSGPLSPDAEQSSFDQDKLLEEEQKRNDEADHEDGQGVITQEDVADEPADEDDKQSSHESEEASKVKETAEDKGHESDEGEDETPTQATKALVESDSEGESKEISPRKKRAIIESDDEDDEQPTQAQFKRSRIESDEEDDDQPTQAQIRKSVLPDSDEDDEQPTQAQMRSIVESDEEDDDQPTQAQPRKKVVIESEDEDEEGEKRKEISSAGEEDDESDRKPKKRVKIQEDSDEEKDEDEDKPKQGGDKELIADIFGESDGEEEFEGFEEKKVKDEEESGDERPSKPEEGDEEAPESGQAEAALPDISSDEDEDVDDRPRKAPEGMVYDFDIMMEKKREENYRKRKRRNVDIINDSDDLIADLIRDMKAAVEEDFELNKNRMAATQKLKLLPKVDAFLKKVDLREAFLDSGILSVLTDWLTPLPDRSLPNLNVREAVLKRLLEFNVDDTERLKASGIGKAVMYLYKHPKETKDNKRRALQLIKNWSRPIFNLDTDFSSISKEEREQRDIDLNRGRARRDSTDGGGTSQEAAGRPLRPGEKGWVPRARVPQPSMRDYVVRPKSTVEGEIKVNRGARQAGRFEKTLRTFRDKKKINNAPRPVKLSIEGRGTFV